MSGVYVNSIWWHQQDVKRILELLAQEEHKSAFLESKITTLEAQIRAKDEVIEKLLEVAKHYAAEIDGFYDSQSRQVAIQVLAELNHKEKEG